MPSTESSAASEKAIEQAAHDLATSLVDPSFGPTHTQLKYREEKRAKIALAAAHAPNLGLDRSVCLRDVVDFFRAMYGDDPCREWAAHVLECEFGGQPRG